MIGVQRKNIRTYGVETFYLEAGHPDSETIIFLHGFGDTKDSFLRAAIPLRKDYHLIFPDVPGFSESSKDPNWKYNLDNYSNWLTSFIQDLSIKRPHLIGNSLGGGIITRTSLDNPDLIRSLCLVNSAGVIPESSHSIYHQFEEGVNIFDIKDFQQFEKFLSIIMYNPPFVPKFVKEFIYNTYYKPHNEFYKKVIGDLIEGVSSTKIYDQYSNTVLNQQIKKVNCPTLILWGEKDNLIPVEVANIFHQNIKKSNLHIFKNVGHAPQIEIPFETGKKYIEFLQNVQ